MFRLLPIVIYKLPDGAPRFNKIQHITFFPCPWIYVPAKYINKFSSNLFHSGLFYKLLALLDPLAWTKVGHVHAITLRVSKVNFYGKSLPILSSWMWQSKFAEMFADSTSASSLAASILVCHQLNVQQKLAKANKNSQTRQKNPLTWRLAEGLQPWVSATMYPDLAKT